MTPQAVAAAAGAVVASVADARTGFIPNAVSVTTLVAALALAALRDAVLDGACGALAAGGALLALHVLTRGRGIGLGDVKLAAAVGAGCGPAAATLALGIAFTCGGAFAAALLVMRRARRDDTLPFGPFIAMGTLAALAGMPA